LTVNLKYSAYLAIFEAPKLLQTAGPFNARPPHPNASRGYNTILITYTRTWRASAPQSSLAQNNTTN